MNTHVMIDLETLGTRPGSVIVSIGAVVFDERGVQRDRSFEARIDIDSSLEAGLTVDGSTIEWWMRREPSAREVFRCQGDPLSAVLARFWTWLDNIPEAELYVWGNGASFDLALLAEAFRRARYPKLPWRFTNERCYRTLKALHLEIVAVKPEVAHNALSDAIAQAEHAVQILRGGAS